MNLKKISENFLVSDQIHQINFPELIDKGIKTIICVRPDGEGVDQPNFIEIQKQAELYSIDIYYLPVTSGKITDEQVKEFESLYSHVSKPVLSYCRSGMRAISLWAMANVEQNELAAIVALGRLNGFDLEPLVPRILKDYRNNAITTFDVVIVGAGAAGISTAASLLSRQSNLNIALIDPAETHYYQPGWTMVGAGIFSNTSTAKQMASLVPKGVEWIKAAVAGFDPDNQQVILEGCKPIRYSALVVCPGLKLNWHGIEGLAETLGKNGVTSNYRYDLAPYTWELVRNFNGGKAVFTQPPMPIKCAGAPQKAMYLSADYWLKQGKLSNIDLNFYTSGAVLFGVKEYVPALMQYIEKYKANLHFSNQLIKVDGANKRAWFKDLTDPTKPIIETDFDILHAVPPQQAPDFVSTSLLADANGWVDVNQFTLQHNKYPNIFSLGDVTNAPNAKTAAAARKQAPIVASNVLEYLHGSNQFFEYDGYGSCPLTVERGKIVLAEFGYGGKLLPSFPKWFLDGQKPSRLAWLLKEQILPPMYWHGMLKGHEWLVKPNAIHQK